MRPTLPVFLLLATVSCLASAQVYRCGNAYSNEPCKGGSVVPVEDARTREDARSATSNANSDARLADAMAKERLAAEARAAKPLIVPTPAPKASEPRQPAVFNKGHKHGRGDQFVAVAPRDTAHHPKKKKKAKEKANG